ncbi:MAG: acyl carrier protein [Bryobacteraceae bacterium]
MISAESKIREIVARITGLMADIPGDANLYLDLGVASVYALNLLTELEQEFDAAIPDEDFVEATSIAQLAALMDRLTADNAPGEYASA